MQLQLEKRMNEINGPMTVVQIFFLEFDSFI